MEGKLLVAVFTHTNEVKALSWSKAIDWLELYPGRNIPNIWDVKAFVTGDGKAVVLRDRGGFEKNGLRILGPGEKDDHGLRPFDHAQLTGATPRVSGNGSSYSRPSGHAVVRYWISSVLDFLVEDQNLYAIWFAQTDQWAVISLNDFQQTIVKDENQLKRLNELARNKAEERVLEHQPPPLRQALRAVQMQARKFFPSMARPQPRILSAETSPAYLFLAARRRAAHKAYLEKLVTYPLEGVQHGDLIGVSPMEFVFMGSSERVLGDFLLSRWNGDTNREYETKGTSILVPDEPMKYLGTVRTSVELPIEIPDNGGNIWVYLIPAQVAAGKRNGSREVTTFLLSLAYAAQQFGPMDTRPSQGEAVFKAISPGEYRLKFVWERHPAATMSYINRYTALAGDYESAESDSFVVKAGETLQGLSISCTNRIGDGKGYEEDDALMKKERKRE